MKLAAWLLAAGVTGGAAVYSAAPPVFPAPIVSASTATIPGRDSVAIVVAYTRRCILTACPVAWDVRHVSQTADGFALERHVQRPGLRDTLRYARPICPQAVTLRLEVRAVASLLGQRSNPGKASLAISCRPKTAQEALEDAALLDSFPKGNTRIVLGDWQYRTPKAIRDIELVEQLRTKRTRADSQALERTFAQVETMPDSSPTAAAGDTAVMLVLHEVALCWLGKNRYTGEVVILDGRLDACERPRARWQSQRSG